MKTGVICVPVEYDENVTDLESLSSALDILLETALSTDGILDEYGDPYFGCSFVRDDEDEP
jgi:hypothetical protein